MKKRIEIKLPEREKELIDKIAETLQMTRTETIRNALRFGLKALLKFETGANTVWEEIKKIQPKDNKTGSKTCHSQKDNTPKPNPKEDETYDLDAEMEKLKKWEEDHKS